MALVPLAAPVGCHVGDGPSPDADVQALIAQADALNRTCRGGSGGDPATLRTCDHRDAAVRQLAERGGCYGAPDQVEADNTWQRRAAGS